MRRVIPVIMVLLAGVPLLGCRSNDNPGVEPGERFGNVENGTVYDHATVEIGSAKRLILPHSVTVRRGGDAGKVELYMKKTLAFVGHPPEAMTLEGVRKNMGCATKLEGGTLMIATYGEWDSEKEGAAGMKLIAVLATGQQHESQQGLSGVDSIAQGKGTTGRVGFWYTAASPASGWTTVPSTPDAERTAK